LITVGFVPVLAFAVVTSEDLAFHWLRLSPFAQHPKENTL